MYRINCSEVWGGFKNENLDACSAALATSLFSGASDGGKGGDIYYFSVCQADKLTRIALADVVGHGERVSRVSEWLYESLRARMNDGDNSELLAELNQLTSDHGFDAITTAAVISFNASGSYVEYAYAGHPPMLVRRNGAARWEPALLGGTPDRLADLPLGVEPRTRYTERTVQAAAGDRLFLYTDGVIETPGPGGELFGTQRLNALLDAHGSRSLPETKAAVLTALHEFAGGELNHDDVTLLAVELR